MLIFGYKLVTKWYLKSKLSFSCNLTTNLQDFNSKNEKIIC